MSEKLKGGSRAKGKALKFCLLRWLDGEEVGVVPSTSIRPGQECYCGAVGEFKWQSKYYEAEVLKVSGKIAV